ncbi:hypothetical protein A3B05_03375 [Candidatus Giovannonibacteria bacterium RIFCSPLOWO2_01_FULL_43_160]|uniref:ROK family protein n=2 Tax=Candidatus Giovannoniibacteriota TaxID=1752738 RepID=A0A0G1IQP8_9BACT|nr:MAG: hypothetical protein UV72_C0015G0004 [Candidatus Giovannonibacteria bacterium GW2011_GWB1_43_13]KKT61681.1 MAG: hypothetical protein UW55_C0027G0004 [Candidatus Giovannonibacteria bacterium GW2011_GWA2_44_26]OGF58858.1 MAG: hypothetical protein A2652_02910 [Candidatus Giovannonibacteria bacterium RIFCSPHIGHO2_01_FULL_43_140]OGF70156.1 MAG: hypothetical protein A3C76_01885 [Candidatus Giovannonibacteria bacterium RIFCSPHIGHO2_02_FULL_44_51]OGF71864.1 MAG: hypothetical protein A3E35_00520
MNIMAGIDIGGTKIRAVLLDGKRTIKAREFKTPKNLTTFKKLLGGILNSYNAKKIGIGAPGAISKNKILFCPNIKYLKNFDISQLARPAVGGGTWTSKFKLDNDARCFARAECGKKPCLAIILGTGVGRAFAKNGKVLKIKKFEYSERWERQYQKLRDSKNNKRLSAFLTAKISVLIKKFKPEVIIISGGVSTRKNLKLGFPHKKSKLGKNAAAIGATMLFQ